MSIFNTILSKLGIKPKEEKPAGTPTPQLPTAPDISVPVPKPAPASPPPPPAPPKPVQQTPNIAPPPPTSFTAGPIPTTPPPELNRFTQQPKPAAPTPIPVVDVVSKLQQLAAENPQQLDWRVSIVDLLKLLGIDSSYQARKELAVELGCPPELMSDSAKMNTWLHKTVLQKLAENGGNVPKELLD